MTCAGTVLLACSYAGFILVEHFKENIKNMSDTPVLADICASLERCNLQKQDEYCSGSTSIEELKAFLGNKKKRAAEM